MVDVIIQNIPPSPWCIGVPERANAPTVGVLAASPLISVAKACCLALLAMPPPSLEIFLSRCLALGGGPCGAAPGSRAELGTAKGLFGMPKLGLGCAEWLPP